MTIGGQSAGAANVAKLISTPLATGLFQGAVLQSVGGDLITQAEGDARTEDLLSALNYDPALHGADIQTFLLSRTDVELMDAWATIGTMFAGFVDGYVLSGTHFDAINADTYNSVPIMVGSTTSEFKNFMPLYAGAFGNAQWANVYDLFDSGFDPNKEWTLEEIFPTQANEDLYQSFAKSYSDNWKADDVEALASLLQDHQDNGVYAYEFKWGEAGSASPEFSKVFGAAHAMDIAFFFGYDQTLFGYALNSQNRSGFEDLQGIMMTYLGNFVKTGDPGQADGISWQEWSNVDGEAKCMLLKSSMTEAQIEMGTEELIP